jgi:energy-converting hydrogenase Eha subunit E
MIIDSVVIILIVTVAKQTLILLCLVLLRMLALLAFIFVFNTTISNISAISWRSVLVVEEAGEHGENHRP